MAEEDHIRVAGAADAEVVAQLLHDFNVEYDDPTPEASEMAERIRELITGDDTLILLIGKPAVGVALMRFRRSLWGAGQDCYLAELYIKPDHRGKGLGEQLLRAAIEAAKQRDAHYMELGTSEDDIAARNLYQKLGFTNVERPGGPVMYVYEREL